jgi:GNAT superfamily N-acetyltransferase
VPLPAVPAGLTTRTLTFADAEAVAELIGACELEEDGFREVEAADLGALWRLLAPNLASRSVGVFDGDRIVAAGTVRGKDADVDVRPAARGGGIGAALLPWTWIQARAQAHDRTAQAISDARVDGIALLQTHGYASTWTGWSFRMPISGMTHPELPAGFDFVDDDYNHERDGRAGFDVINTAFNEWREKPDDDWLPWNTFIGRHALLAPWGSPLIVHAGRIVGVSIAFDPGPGQDAWIQQLAVERAHRGRGLGLALIQETFARFAVQGFSFGGLETDSRSGALSFYEHVGFDVRASWTRWEKWL